MKQHLVQRLAQLNESQFQCKPCRNDYLKLQVNKTVWDFGEMVSLLYTPVDSIKCVLSMVGGEEGVLYQTLAGQPVDFMLVIKDGAAGNHLESGGMVRASVSHSREATLNHELHVHDSGDGSYLFSYRPETGGLCTLLVMVEGHSVCGSPLTWKVKPKVKETGKLSLLTSSPEHDEGGKGKHCWKLMHLKRGFRSVLEIGVRCYTPADGVFNFCDTETKRCTWCRNRTRSSPTKYNYSRSDNPYQASITGCTHGDIFSDIFSDIFLNYETSKLVIYNHRSKQAEVFTGVEGEKVGPIISPHLIHAGIWGTGFTLDI